MNTTTLTLNESWRSRRNLFDWVFAALVIAGGLFAFTRYAGVDGLLREDRFWWAR